MDNPLDLKLLMNQANISATSLSPVKVSSAYGEKIYFEVEGSTIMKAGSGNSKDSLSPKEMPMVQIVKSSAAQQIPVQTSQQSQVQIIQEQDLAAYKKAYGVDAQQVFTLAPMGQYQVLNSNRTINSNEINLSGYSPIAYVVSADGSHSLQPITELIQEDPLQTAEVEIGTVSPTSEEPQIMQINPSTTTVVPVTHTTTNRNLSRSMKDRPYKCDQCTASYLEGQELELHKKKHTGSQDGPFTCEDCHFTFMYKGHYKSHKLRCQKKKSTTEGKSSTIIVNPVKRQFPTHQTASPTKTSSNRVHVNQQYITVPVSQNKVTGHHGILNRVNNGNSGGGVTHISHGGQTISKQVISKFNPENPSFKRVKTETKLGRPYECNECDASFQSDFDLKNHKSKHTGEGPFKCDACQFVFLYRKLHDAHKRRCKKRTNVTTLSTRTTKSSNTNSTSCSVAQTSTSTNNVIVHPQTRVVESILPTTTVNTNYTSGGNVQIINQHDIAQNNAISVLSGPIQMHSLNGQHSIIEVRSGEGQEIQHIQLGQHHPLIEQVLVCANGSGFNGNRQDIKYEMIDLPEGVNANTIMNLIKVKAQNP